MLGKLKTTVQFVAIAARDRAARRPDRRPVPRRVGRCSSPPSITVCRPSTTSRASRLSLIGAADERRGDARLRHRRQRARRRRARRRGCVERGDEVVALARSDARGGQARAPAPTVVARRPARRGRARRRRCAGCDARLPRRRRQHAVPDRPGARCSASTSRGAEPRSRAAARGRRRARSCTRRRRRRSARPTGTVGSEDSPHRGCVPVRLRALEARGRARGARGGARAPGVEVVLVNPSSVQGPGRAGGTGRILIALPQRPPEGVRRHAHQLVDIDDCRRGPPAGGRARRAGRALRAQRRDADVRRGARPAPGHERPRGAPAVPPRGVAPPRRASSRASAVRGRDPPVCRAMVRTMLHGHPYDGSRATRELGLDYTPVEDTLRRTAAWAWRQGLLRHPLPG